MSEYQYYAFQAVDRPLTEREMRVLRAASSRANITPTHFTNFYTFGDFKGDVAVWKERYFDAFLYLANWGARELMFRFPKGVPPAAGRALPPARQGTGPPPRNWVRRRRTPPNRNSARSVGAPEPPVRRKSGCWVDDERPTWHRAPFASA